MTDTSHTQVELLGNAGTNTNQVCVKATDANGNPTPDWGCTLLFSVTTDSPSYDILGDRGAMRVNDAPEQYLGRGPDRLDHPGDELAWADAHNNLVIFPIHQ